MTTPGAAVDPLTAPRRGGVRWQRGGVVDPESLVAASPGTVWIDAVGAITLGVLALVLALHQIDRWAFWHDEAFTMDAINGTWDDLVHFARTREINMFTYYVLLKAWTSFGTGDAWIRSLSALIWAIAVPSLFGLARTLFGRPVAWLAAALLALNGFALEYGQEARVYTLSLLIAILATWALVRALRSPTRGRWAVYVALAAVVPYTHVVLMAMYAVHLAAVVTWRPAVDRRILAVVGAAVLALIVPALVLSVSEQAAVLGWVPPITVTGVARGLTHIVSTGTLEPLARLGVPGVAKLLAVMFVGLAAIGAAVGLRRAPTRWATGLVVLWLTLPVAAVLAVSLVKPLFVVRYLIFVIPALAVLVALGVAMLPVPRARPVAAVVALALAANGALGWYGSAPRPDWRTATAWVVAHSSASDRAIYIGDFGRVLRYYARQAGEGSRSPQTVYRGLNYKSPTFVDDLARVGRDIGASKRTLWVVVTVPPLTPPIRDPRLAGLRAVMRLDRVERFDRLVVARFVPLNRPSR